MRPRIKIEWPSMNGMGPRAWDRDEQKMSMHPPLPGYIEHVEAHQHHEVHRRRKRQSSGHPKKEE